MKTFLTISTLFLSLALAGQTTYYVSPSGSDANNLAQAQSQSTPWKTGAHVNSVMASFHAGDHILFEGGQTFTDNIIVGASGTSLSHITFGSYGTGRAIITGLTTVTSLSTTGGNIWESNAAVSTLSTCNTAVINGVRTPVGRWPNSGYRTAGSVTATSITDGSLPSSPTYVGGSIVFQMNAFVLSKALITSESGTTINFNSFGATPPGAAPYFIQNNINTLDVQNEWSYNSTTKKIDVFSTSNPSNKVEVPTIDNLVTVNSVSNITFDNIEFRGANTYIIALSSAPNISIINCKLEFAGVNALNQAGACTGFLWDSDSCLFSNNNHIESSSQSNGTISNSYFYDAGMVAGMGLNNAGNTGAGSYCSITTTGDNWLIKNNQVRRSGYNGIVFFGTSTTAGGSNITIRRNFVDSFCMVKQDGSAIYTWNAQNTPGSVHSNRVIDSNIVTYGFGTGSIPLASGYYMDDNTDHVTLTNNFAAFCAYRGFYLHNAHDITMSGNTSVANGWSALGMTHGNGKDALNLLNIQNNIFAGKQLTSGHAMDLQTVTDAEMQNYGTSDNNYITVPLNENQVVFTNTNNGNPFRHMTIAQWVSFSGKDVHSKKAPVTIADTTKMKVFYNPSFVNKTFSLGGSAYVDMPGAGYSGSVTLTPFTSVVLLFTGTANSLPVVNAGNDITITAPTSSVSVTGTATDADGTISSHTWTRVSGPNTPTIVSPSNFTTSITGLVPGTYVFQLSATDNSGGTATDIMQVIVNPAANVPPVANAGTDRAITLPTSSTTANGGGSDADGTISAILWTQISGPATATLGSPSQFTTSITGLTVAGTYVFELKVTDNSGAFATDQMQVVVSPAPNIPPVTNAGPDQTIQQPASTSTFAGSASDVDGTIALHTWSFISGPATPTISQTNNYTSPVSGMTSVGSYTFQLSAMDNNGATTTDQMVIQVNAAPNQSPSANAGADQFINLPTNSVTVTGIGSDPDGTVASVLWSKISGPATFNIVSAGQSTTVINNLVQGVYVFQFSVTDNRGATSVDVMQVTVNPAANQPPTVDAGVNQTITLPTNAVNVSATGSDPDGTIASYAWSKTSGPGTFTITSASSASTSITNLVAGTYIFQVVVTDNNGATASDAVTIIVNAAPPPNQPPIANGGTDKNITLPANAVSQVGSGTDADGSVASYAWTKISGPATFTIVSPSAASTVINNLVAGTYVFRLTVTDNLGATGSDDVTVIVNPAPNIPPVVNAGPDKTITQPATSTTMAGSATDQDGTITSHTWSAVPNNPATATITTPSSYTTSITGMTVAGTYAFKLSATDNSGATVTDTMFVIVNPGANQPPVADAGADQTDSLQNPVFLTGSGTDADGTVVAYLWTEVSGPTTVTFVSASQPGTRVTGLAAGVYVFRLRVTDNLGDNGFDDVTVTMIDLAPPPPTPPQVNAGPDQHPRLCLFCHSTNTTVTATATAGSDPIGSYAWTQVSGPGAANIISPSSSSTTITGLLRGTYVFRITVTDLRGNSATDTITIDVKRNFLFVSYVLEEE